MNLLAQLASENPVLYQWGPLGVLSGVLTWLVKAELREIRMAIREGDEKTQHKIVGLNRTLLIELLSRENLNIQAKVMARQELEKNGGMPN
jgi:hypothetical protein